MFLSSHFSFPVLSSTSHFFVFDFFFFYRKRNSLEYFSLNTDTAEGLVLNMLLALEVTLILGFQMTVSCTAIKIIQIDILR